MQVDFLPAFALGFAIGQLFCLLWMYLLILRKC
nr:MAG TPA: Maintenance of mitochondrial morphology protein 1 [Caudoviricetes sp.]